MARKYLEELPRLQAQEELRMMEAVALGTGSVKKEVGRHIRSELVRRARGRPQRMQLSKEQAAAMLNMIGIGMKWQRN